jgi:CHAT domain-containing protein
MTEFYADLSHREEKAEALREAQLEILNSGAPPFYWAGFVLDGEPNGNLFPESGMNPSPRSN